MKFFNKDFFINYDQTCSFLRVWSQLLKKSPMENFILREMCETFCMQEIFHDDGVECNHLIID